MMRALQGVETQIENILKDSSRPLSIWGLRNRLRQINIFVPDYTVTRILRRRLQEGKVSFRRGQWAIAEAQVIRAGSNRNAAFLPPPLSPEVAKLLGDKTNQITTEPQPDEIETPSTLPDSQWNTFRKLVRYYRDCVVTEEGKKAEAYLNKFNEQFLFLPGLGSWYPKPHYHWKKTIPLGPHLSSFLTSLGGLGSEQTLVLGYPLEGVYIPGEPDVALVQPIFFFPVEKDISVGNLNIVIKDPRAEINLAWLDYRFKKTPENKRSFLSACGLINRIQSDDEILPYERGEVLFALDYTH